MGRWRDLFPIRQSASCAITSIEMLFPRKLRAGFFSLLLGVAGLAFVLPTVTACGSSQKTTTGEAPVPDAEMKEVVIHVFGMT